VTGTGTHWKLRATREERVSERSQILLKEFGWESGSQFGKRPIESGMSSDGSDTIAGHVPVQET